MKKSARERSRTAAGDASGTVMLERAIDLHRRGRIADARSAYRSVLAAAPDRFEALQNLGLIEAQAGALDTALHLFERAATARPSEPSAQLNVAVALTQLGRLAEAVDQFDRVIGIDARNADAHAGRGNACLALGRPAAALESYDDALALVFADAETQMNRGTALLDLDRPAEALAGFEAALAIDPGSLAAHINHATALSELGRWSEALAELDAVLDRDPGSIAALCNRANVLQSLDRREEALATYQRVLTMDPNHLDAHVGLGMIHTSERRFDAALIEHDGVLTHAPMHAAAANNRAVALNGLRRFDEALATAQALLAARPTFVEAILTAADALIGLGRHEEALAALRQAVELRPTDSKALGNLAYALDNLKRREEAIGLLEKLLALAPDYAYGLGTLLFCRQNLCDWRDFDASVAAVKAAVIAGRRAVLPWAFLSQSGSAAAQRRCAEIYAADHAVAAAGPLRARAVVSTASPRRIKLAYLSADFGDHPVAYLQAELFERHDRERYEIIGVALATPDQSDIGRRVAASFDRVLDVGHRSDADIASIIAHEGIDILVDLGGYTGTPRLVTAYRPAPIQVNYLGFAGTLGAHADYLIADPVVVPQAMSEHYAEFVVRIPDSFMPRDTTVAIPAERPRRETHGLPEQALVLCSFNNSYKLNPASFEIWMRLLGAVEDAVLWLSESNPSAVANLRAEAARRGIAADRLIFAPRLPRIEDHYARLPLADLFLDTWPYNAHTTASDALWAGVPVLTCAGETFASRVAASLLTAIGLPELIADSPSAYERLAFDLARSRDRLAGIRAKLATHRLTYPLFDMARFTRHIEAAYAKMWARHQAGEPPSAFDISPQ